ncbi:hypothetical protein D1159_03005 [Pseudoflavonifractor sp. 524-17]|uniref:DUF6291 domain-containing protein n=1 Tax=Pseudoflavonifractor sp. 524-17 TaxID=2304577 RepID=UPI00137B814D|nr:DUF6291 domain-containing protein [Pseudoflavonifractor sp. 524-17]NCE63570.1 hypothetical protein [Pseudoflavonifractor sp. 524-17]
MTEQPFESFVFYRSFRDAIEEMTDANKLATLLAICDYALYGVAPDLKDAMSRAVFTVAKPSIDANKARCRNGAKGGRPPKKPMVTDSENLWFSKNESTYTESYTESISKTEAKEADKPPKRPRFVPPEVEEVRAYCLERGNGIDPASFVDYYAARGWKLNGGQTMKDWKAAVRTWERRHKTEQRGGDEDDYWSQ